MDTTAVRRFVERMWSGSILPALQEYITIPNQSPAFDPEWHDNGHMDAAVELVARWIQAQEVDGLRLEVLTLAGRTPLIFIEIPGDARETVLLYGHLDKQPPFEGWREGLDPRTPVVKDGRLYGRGAADDGYAAFAAITAIQALQRQGLPHARCLLLVEACEESGSGDLPHYVELLADRLGRPSLVVALDSGCGDYEHLWVTSSLRGLLNGTLTVQTLTEGVHSGAAGGIVPSTFRLARQLLSRMEDERTGAVLPPALYVEVPPERARQAEEAAAVLGADAWRAFPFHGATRPPAAHMEELLLNRTWRPQLEITGAAGLPPPERAGNVLRPSTTLKLSLRLPPTLDAHAAARCVEHLLTSDPPCGATVGFACSERTAGWNAPALDPWLARALQQASQDFFGTPACFWGEGGTIPFMAMLGARFPQAQFVITGVLGPHSNAHGPNEFLELATAQRLTACIASILHAHHSATCR